MEVARTFTTDDGARIACRIRCLILAAMSGLAAAFPVFAQQVPAQAPTPPEMFRPVIAQPGLGGLPVHAKVSVADNVVDSDTLAVVARPAAQVMALLGSARGWCEIHLLQPNVKACAVEPIGDGQRILIHVGTKHFQPADLTPLKKRFELRVERRERGYLAVRLWPEPEKLAEGARPALIEVVALDGKRTGLRMRNHDPLSTGERLLSAGYFTTVGRDKVGFSAAGVDADGKPALVGGLVGGIERNIVRNFLAVETLLEEKVSGPGVPLERRLTHWFMLTERHARQLHEMELAEYLDIKRREYTQSAELQKSIDTKAGK